MRIFFEKITRKQVLSLKCRCGKRIARTVSVTHTVNPFNKDEYGLPKSRSQVADDVLKELSRKASEMTHSEVHCKACASAREQGAA